MICMTSRASKHRLSCEEAMDVMAMEKIIGNTLAVSRVHAGTVTQYGKGPEDNGIASPLFMRKTATR